MYIYIHISFLYCDVLLVLLCFVLKCTPLCSALLLCQMCFTNKFNHDTSLPTSPVYGASQFVCSIIAQLSSSFCVCVCFWGIVSKERPDVGPLFCRLETEQCAAKIEVGPKIRVGPVGPVGKLQEVWYAALNVGQYLLSQSTS